MNYGLTKTRVRLASGAAILALSAGAAMAQEGVEQVVVSSTRLQSAGFDAPTPTTVVSAADLEAQAKPSIFEAITQLPALQGSSGEGYNTGSTTSGLIGLASLGLRGLSPLRTLVLLDSQRVVGGNFNGAVDVSLMPQMLIQRVDVVTGGASASWGSDAIAGVINFVTDKKFEGFKMNTQAGLSTYGDMGQVKFEMAAVPALPVAAVTSKSPASMPITTACCRVIRLPPSIRPCRTSAAEPLPASRARRLTVPIPALPRLPPASPAATILPWCKAPSRQLTA
jgi:hypothetical protein